MKKLILSLIFACVATAHANPLEDQLNKALELVLLSDVSYGGIPFLATKTEERRSKFDAELRAHRICALLGHGSVVNYATGAAPKSVTKFWDVSVQTRVIDLVADSSHSGDAEIFSMIACRAKKTGEKKPVKNAALRAEDAATKLVALGETETTRAKSAPALIQEAL